MRERPLSTIGKGDGLLKPGQGLLPAEDCQRLVDGRRDAAARDRDTDRLRHLAEPEPARLGQCLYRRVDGGRGPVLQLRKSDTRACSRTGPVSAVRCLRAALSS